MLNINPKKTYVIGFWPGEGGGRVLCVHSTDTVRVFESKNDAQSAAGCLPTPLQLVEVLGENLLTAGQPLLLEGGRFAQSAGSQHQAAPVKQFQALVGASRDDL